MYLDKSKIPLSAWPKPSEYPLLVRVGQVHYHIVFYPKMINGDLGSCDDSGKIISISLGQSREEMLSTYFHEWLHAVESEYGIKLGHKVIRKLEYALVDLYLQSPKGNFSPEFLPVIPAR